MSYTVGLGFDIHRLAPGRPLVLGGITIEHDKGLLGHSDGDVIVHALCDAILGATGQADIGELFPDTAKETEGIYSLEMLKTIISDLSSGYIVGNVDINCICEKPKLSGYRKDMIRHIAEACKISDRNVSIKFRTHEGLGEIGAGEAICAQAVVLIKNTKDQEEEL
jgi:2-C-methyl-D-erythritol 2,4-cyclodiphosphate synthase